MPRHANLPFHLYVHVDNRALGPQVPPGSTAAIWHAVYARPGQVVMAHVLLETGAEWCGVPLQQIVADRNALTRWHDGHPPLGQDLQPWGAMGDCIETVHMQYLEGLLVMGSGAGPGFTGRHTGIVIDWADGFSRYPQEHKPLNLIERSDGHYLLFPNNYCRFMDKHWTHSRREDDLKKYRRGDQVHWEQ